MKSMNAMRGMTAVKIIILCLLGSGANFFFSSLVVHVIRIPLYLDTVFSAAICFGVGLIPGLAAAILTHTFFAIRDGGFTPFIICSIAEVFIIWRLKPSRESFDKIRRAIPPDLAAKEISTFVSLLGSLLLLYISALIVVSILGGLIDFFYHSVFSVDKFYFSPEDTVKISLLRSGIPVLLINILSRIPVNIVDRFIVIFGGYFIGKGISFVKGD